jgi:putative transposase
LWHAACFAHVVPPRLPRWDYRSPGAYFVTACTHRRRPYFGLVEGEHVRLSPLGALARDWLRLAVAVDHSCVLQASVVMPDHIHFLVQQDTLDASRTPLDMRVRDLKARLTHEARTRAWLGPRDQLWQRGFFDRVVRTQKEHDALLAYIETNPLRWTLRRSHG